MILDITADILIKLIDDSSYYRIHGYYITE